MNKLNSTKFYYLLLALGIIVLLTAVLISSYRFPAARIPSSGERAIQAKNARMLQKIGKAYSEIEDGRSEAAEALLKELLVQDSSQPMALRLLGRIYYETGRYEDARNVYLKLIERNDFDAPAHNNLGQVLVRLGQYKEAQKELETALEINPSSPLVYLNLSSLYSAMGNTEEARKYFLEAHQRMTAQFEKNEFKTMPIPRTP